MTASRPHPAPAERPLLLVLADAAELRAEPALLAAYCSVFDETSAATLVVAAGELGSDAAVESLAGQVDALGIAEERLPDIAVVPADVGAWVEKGPPAHATLGQVAAAPADLPRFSATDAGALAALATSFTAAAAERGRLLLVVDLFHPSVGGGERLAEAVGVALQRRGWQVEVAARHLPERTSLERRGMRIHEVAGDPVAAVAELATRSRFDVLLGIAAPQTWPVPAVLALPTGTARRVVVPCINEEGYRAVTADTARLETLQRLLRSADGIAYSSYAGWDARLYRKLEVAASYVPNAVGRLEPDEPFRVRCGVDPETPLLLVVGNLWPEKNHAALLDLLREDDGDWRLVHLGHPSPAHPATTAAVLERVGRDPRVTFVPGVPPATVAAAMSEADVLLLPSLAEATPLVLLEAMSHELPWVATPTCGSAADHAGGVIVELDRFPETIAALLGNPEARARLGRAGRAHWLAAYRWEVVGDRYDRLARGLPLDDVPLPSDLLAETAAVARTLVAADTKAAA